MIGLMFLGAALLWLGLTVYLTIKVPRLLGLKNYASWLLRLLLVSLLLVGPFVDEIVGMRQFERLCEEQAGIQIRPVAASVRNAKRTYSPEVILPGYLINIVSTTATYVDLDSNEVYLRYNHFSTRGGRVAGLALMGGWHSCSAEKTNHKDHQQLQQIPSYTKIVIGAQIEKE